MRSSLFNFGFGRSSSCLLPLLNPLAICHYFKFCCEDKCKEIKKILLSYFSQFFNLNLTFSKIDSGFGRSTGPKMLAHQDG